MGKLEAISIRVPKTASSAFENVLTQVYDRVGAPWNINIHIAPESPRSLIYTNRKLFKTMWDLCIEDLVGRSDVRAVHGHTPSFLWSKHYPDAQTFVWIREPRTMCISGFWFAKKIGHLSERITIYDYLNIEHRKNWQTFFAGKDLSHYSFVGIYEHLEDDIWLMSKIFEWNNIDVPKLNANKDPGYIRFKEEILLSDEFEGLIQKNYAQDLALYKQALEMRGYV